jgi:hypothetical protein
MAPRKPTRNREQQLRIGDAIPIVVVADPYPNPSVIFSELPVSSIRSIPLSVARTFAHSFPVDAVCSWTYDFHWPGGPIKGTKRMGKTGDRRLLKIRTNRSETRTVNVAWP